MSRAAVAAVCSTILLAGCSQMGSAARPGTSGELSPSSRSAVTSASRPRGEDACANTRALKVPATANIFGAGITELPNPGGGGGGAHPPCVAVPAGVAIVRVTSTGLAALVASNTQGEYQHRCASGQEAYAPAMSGPDGGPTSPCADGSNASGGTIDAVGVVSGITSFDRVGYLVGVFLPASAPIGPPPPGLDFDGHYGFAALRPRVAQLFFIGDGRTTTGIPQRFFVPAGASRLYLGIADAYSVAGPAGYYEDNHGSFDVAVRFLR